MAATAPVVSKVHALHQRVIAEGLLDSRRIAVRDHPEVLAGVEVDGHDPPEGTLENRGMPRRDRSIAGRRRRPAAAPSRARVLPVISGVSARWPAQQRWRSRRGGDEDDAGDRIGGRRTGDVRAAIAARADIGRALALRVAAMRGGLKSGASRSCFFARSSASALSSGV